MKISRKPFGSGVIVINTIFAILTTFQQTSGVVDLCSAKNADFALWIRGECYDHYIFLRFLIIFQQINGSFGLFSANKLAILTSFRQKLEHSTTFQQKNLVQWTSVQQKFEILMTFDLIIGAIDLFSAKIGSIGVFLAKKCAIDLCSAKIGALDLCSAKILDFDHFSAKKLAL
jgi:hypothetical protein